MLQSQVFRQVVQDAESYLVESSPLCAARERAAHTCVARHNSRDASLKILSREGMVNWEMGERWCDGGGLVKGIGLPKTEGGSMKTTYGILLLAWKKREDDRLETCGVMREAEEVGRTRDDARVKMDRGREKTEDGRRKTVHGRRQTETGYCVRGADEGRREAY